MDNKEFLIELITKSDVASAIKKEMERLLLIIPELKGTVGFAHCHPHHHLDVWEHTLLALSNSENQLNIRLSLLLHDIGKPLCYQQDGAVRHYKGHAEKSAVVAREILERLGFERSRVDDIAEIIRRHDTPLCESDVAAQSMLARQIFSVQKCDALAHNPAYNQKRIAYIDRMEAIFRREGHIPQASRTDEV